MLIAAIAVFPFLAVGQYENRLTSEVFSKTLGQQREVWVALPENYETGNSYPVLYVLDAETHFSLVVELENALSASKKIPEHIVVGVPHINMEKERVQDLTFSLSAVNPYGDKVLPPFFNEQNCGGGYQFLKFLNNELVPHIDTIYSTSGFNVLCGHSLSGYFAAYILAKTHAFQAIQLYDPSIWYASGEATKQLERNGFVAGLSVFLAYQQNPGFHFRQVKTFGENLLEKTSVTSKINVLANENHHSIFLPAFLKGMEWLYNDYKKRHFKLKKERPYTVPE